MAKDLSAVGNAASASKATAMNYGKEMFKDHVEIERADNGGFIVTCHYAREPRRGETYSPYVLPKKHAFKTLNEAFKDVRALFDDGDGDA